MADSDDAEPSRVYGGVCDYVHIADKTRKLMGQRVASYVDRTMRELAKAEGKQTEGKLICPGCSMIALFNAAIALADDNGQSRAELGRTMAQAFAKLASDPASGMTEEIEVLLDND